MEGRQFNRRTLAILVVLTALLLLFFGVLYNLQVLHVDDYRAQSVVKIANRKTVEAARGELLDRYGDAPKSVLALLDVALLRAAAAKAGISDSCSTSAGTTA